MLEALLSWPLIAGCRLYQRAISPLLGNHCRFNPTCSEYLIQALKTRGFFVGLCLGAKRILRCNSLFDGGEDPVPRPGSDNL